MCTNLNFNIGFADTFWTGGKLRVNINDNIIKTALFWLVRKIFKFLQHLEVMDEGGGADLTGANDGKNTKKNPEIFSNFFNF